MKKNFFFAAIFYGSISFANVNSLSNNSSQEHWNNNLTDVSKKMQAIESFNDKLNVTFVEKLFESKEDMFLWIDANLERTKFKSLVEAKSEWEFIETMQEEEFEISNNSNLKSAYELMIRIQIKTLSGKMQISDECTDKFMAYSEAHSEIYANQIEKLYSEYKGKERDERFNKIHFAISKNDFIRMNNCTSYFRNCIGI